jgi:hypothetical protein
MEVAMKWLVCPVSALRIDETTARVTGFMMATMISLYAYTGMIYFVMAIAIDYFIRAFTNLKHSPFSWFASQVVRIFGWPEVKIDKAPKIFAARVGFLFSLAGVVLYYIHPTSSLVVSLLLMAFALLESILNLCVGCLVYTHIVLPIFNPES